MNISSCQIHAESCLGCSHLPSKRELGGVILIALGVIAVVTAVLCALALTHQIPRTSFFNALGVPGTAVSGGISIPLIVAGIYLLYSQRHLEMTPLSWGRQTHNDRDCNGKFDKQFAEQEIWNLNVEVGKLGEGFGVSFHQEDLEKEQITGGACTAMSLRLADGFLSSEHTSLAAYYVDVEEAFQGAIPLDRTIQAVLNTIRVDESLDFQEAMRKKVEALVCSRPSLQVTTFAAQLFQSRSSLDTLLKGLECGLYFVRTIDKTDEGDKGEIWGHSMLLQKSGRGYELYDPNFGVTQSRRERKTANNLFRIKKIFPMTHLSFSRLSLRSA